MSIRAWLAKRQIKSVFERLGKAADATNGDENARLSVFVDGLNILTEGQRDIGAEPKISIEAVKADGFVGDRVFYEGTSADRAILFLHGGGYVWGEARHFHDTAARLSRLNDCQVLVPTYSLAPDHKYPTQLNEALAAYDYLLAEGVLANRIALLGDSAGGNLAMALAQKLVATKRPSQRPSALCLYSPWLDMTGNSESVTRNAARDIMLSPKGIKSAGQFVAGDIPLSDPRLSPLFGVIDGLPATHIQASKQEILLDDTVRLAEKLRAAGIETDVEIWSGLWHDFQQTARVVPEARKALEMTSRFIGKQWAE